MEMELTSEIPTSNPNTNTNTESESNPPTQTPSVTPTQTPETSSNETLINWNVLSNWMSPVTHTYQKNVSDFINTVKTEGSSGIVSITQNIKEFAIQAKNVVQDTLLTDDEEPEQEIQNEQNEQNENVQQEPSLLDQLDAMAEKAEDYIGSNLMGMASQFSNLIKNVVNSEQNESSSSFENKKVPTDRKSTLISVMKMSPNTYLQDYNLVNNDNPTQGSTKSSDTSPVKKSSQSQYAEFASQFQFESKALEIQELLREDVAFQKLMSSLVPHRVSKREFWLKYFFRVSEIEFEEKERVKILEGCSFY